MHAFLMQFHTRSPLQRAPGPVTVAVAVPGPEAPPVATMTPRPAHFDRARDRKGRVLSTARNDDAQTCSLRWRSRPPGASADHSARSNSADERWPRRRSRRKGGEDRSPLATMTPRPAHCNRARGHQGQRRSPRWSRRKITM